MTELADSSLEFARTIRKAIAERDEVLAPVLEAYDAATSERDRFSAACELVITSRSAQLHYDIRIAEASQRLKARDMGAGA